MCRKKFWNAIGTTLALALICFVGPLIRPINGGFAVGKLYHIYPSDSKWFAEPRESDEKIRELLNQKFYYFGKGGQCFAFLSEDQQYILKFFNQSHYEKNYKRHQLKPGPLRRENDFSHTLLAYRELGEETGLLMLHLCPAKSPLKPLTLIDASHIAHSIDLNRTEFVLQKRMKLPMDALREAMEQGDEKRAKELLDALFAFIKKRLDKNLIDDDSKLYTNFGFIGDKVYQLDSGQISKITHSEDLRRDLEVFRLRNRRFHRWITTNYPTLLPHYLAHVESLRSYYEQKIQTFHEMNR